MPDGSVQLLLVGTNHRHAPIGVREELAARAHGDMLVSAVIQEPAVAEAVGLSTCNRCELYMVGEDVGELRQAAVKHLAGYAGGRAESLEPLLYVKEGADAAEHLFSVGAGLDSMVPGEAQILSQLRGAYLRALEGGSTGAVSNRLFHEAIEAGKRVRHETAFGSSNASVASVAAELVREKLGALNGVPVLVVGAGKVAELVATNLVARGADRIVVANRSPERAAELAARFDGVALSLERLPEAIADAGVVICSTLSERPLITPALVAGGRSRVFVDLAMPRDVDPAVGELTGQTLVNVDDLEQTVRQNIEVRQGEADRARVDRRRAGGRVPRLAGGPRGGARHHVAAGARGADPDRGARPQRRPLGGDDRARPRTARPAHPQHAQQAAAPARPCGSRRWRPTATRTGTPRPSTTCSA